MTKNKRKLVTAVLALLLALLIIVPILGMILSATAVTQSEIDAKKAEKDAIAEKMDELRGQIGTLQAEQASIIEQKAALDRQNELTRQEIELINEQIDLYAKLIETKAVEVEQAIIKEQEQMEKYRTRMRAMEENGTLSYITILFKAKSFSDLLARIDYISEVLEYDSQLEADFIAAREHVQQVKAEYEVAKVEEEAVQAELLRRKADLEAQIEYAYMLIAELEKDIEAYTIAFEENAALEAELDSDINALIAQLEAERKAAEAAAAASNGGGGGGGSYVGTGTLTWPLPSSYSVSSYYGNRIHPIFGTNRFHAGWDIGGTSGASILASDGGTIVTAMYSDSYGNYVMINHGNGLYTLYAHMSSMAVSAGQTVTQGQTIGYVGSTGWSTGPHLHFEVRVNGSTVDPGNYFSA